MNARLYDAGAGIFTSVDPVFADMYRTGGLNAYVYGNPFSFVDPTGMNGRPIQEDALNNIVIPNNINDQLLLQLQVDMRNRLSDLDLRQRGDRAILASFASSTGEIPAKNGISVIRSHDYAGTVFRNLDDSLRSSLAPEFISRSRDTINNFYFDPLGGVFGLGSFTYGFSMARNLMIGSEISTLDLGVTAYNGMQSINTLRGLDALSFGLEDTNLSLIDKIQYQGVRGYVNWFEKNDPAYGGFNSYRWWDRNY